MVLFAAFRGVKFRRRLVAVDGSTMERVRINDCCTGLHRIV